jgi:hypothetical protein
MPSPTPVPGATQSPAAANLISVQGAVTSIGFPLIVITTDQAQAIRLDVGTYTQVTRADGSSGTTADLKVGQRVEVQYDASIKIARVIKIL